MSAYDADTINATPALSAAAQEKVTATVMVAHSLLKSIERKHKSLVSNMEHLGNNMLEKAAQLRAEPAAKRSGLNSCGEVQTEGYQIDMLVAELVRMRDLYAELIYAINDDANSASPINSLKRKKA